MKIKISLSKIGKKKLPSPLLLCGIHVISKKESIDLAVPS